VSLRRISPVIFLVLVSTAVGARLARPTAAFQGGPPGASVSTLVAVPASMRSSPFNVNRNLTVPPNFSISVYARIGGARFMAVAPNGDLLVSHPGSGRVILVRPNAGGDPLISDFVAGLRNPHDIVFHQNGATTHLYISESHQINRYVYTAGDTFAEGRQVVVPNLPDASSPELGGSYGHQLKNIAVGPDHKLYVSIASVSNASPSDAVSDPVRCAVYQYNADGSGGRLFARGLRNAEGLAFVPGTNVLWVAVNNRDNIAYPFHNDWNGDGSDDFGKVITSYVDNHPPDEFTSVRDGANYGWPYANPNPDTAAGLNNMPFDFDAQNNPNWSLFPESAFTRIDKGIQAHSAPLGLSFLQGTNFPADYREGAVIGLHGSWNRQVKTGYKVIYFPWNAATGLPGAQIDLVKGWLNESNGSVWGRPVDAVPDLAGNLLISDDYSGTIYKLTYGGTTPTPTPTPTPPAQSVASFTLINADSDQPVAGFNPLGSGATINFAALGTRNLSICANTSPATVGSVRFAYDGNQNYKLENAVPYCIAGDSGPDYLPWTPTVGSHTLSATPYSQSQGQGTAGAALTVNFTVVDGGGGGALTGADVGSVGRAGSTSLSGGVYTVVGSGADIWNTADGFHFAYRALNGNGELVARVTAVGNTDPWAKAGVMIRETLSANSKHAMMVLTPGNGAAFQQRTAAGGASTHTTGGAAGAPLWVRIVRSGSTLTGYRSADGATWTQVGSATVSMASGVYIGLAVTAHNNAASCTATFDNVR